MNDSAESIGAAQNDLRERVRSAIPDNVVALMDEIETFAGLQIAFDLYKFPPRPNEFNPKAPGSVVSHDRATIYLHDFEDIDAHGLTHELLHVRRYWNEGVPQVQPARNIEANLQSCSNVENELEHLAIVPQEADYGFNSSDYWNAVARAKWQRWPWPDITNPLGRRNNALLGRLSLGLVTDKGVRALAEDCLRSEGLFHEAERFAERINQFLANKPRAAACAQRFLQVPKGLLHLVYFDVKNRARRNVPLPDH